MSKSEYEKIKEELRIRDENKRKELLAQTTGRECSPTSVRFSPELREKARVLAYKKNRNTEISQLLKDLLIAELKREELL